MRSIQTKIIIMVSAIMLVIVVLLLVISTIRMNTLLDIDSDNYMKSLADYYADKMDENFRSTEQSVGSMYNYALKRAETYTHFLTDKDQRDRYTNDVAELAKSIAENTSGAMSVYFRYNPEDYGSSNGLWYTVNLEDGTWETSVPTDMSLYDKNDIQHVGWYYIPVETGAPMWMDPYYNANLGVDMISYIIPYFYGEYTVGIIGMDIGMEVLKTASAGIRLYDSGRAFLIDRKGNLIYHEDYPSGRRFVTMYEKDQKYFEGILRLTPDVVTQYPDRDGSGQKLILKELRNGMLLGLYVPIEEINRPQGDLLTQQLSISGFILLIALFVSLLIARTMTAPLKKITEVAKQYAGGNFDEEMSVETNDEIGILSRSLQSMSTSLKEQIEKSDAANRAKSTFLANMSHEIRTPMNAVLGMNEMILRESKDEIIKEYALNIQSAGRTLLSLINSILDFSKIEDGKMDIIPVSYDLASLVNNLVNSISERARTKGLDLIVNVDGSLPCVLKGDDVRISQVIMNLLTNAVKYTEKGSVILDVRNGGNEDGKVRLRVRVSDTGIGIRKESLDDLFDSFTRIDEKHNRNIEGTGLGMAIVTRLLRMMGSELKVRSIYGKGSEFSFELMQQIVDIKPIGDFEERIKDEYKKGNEFGNYPQIRGARILVVDDYDMNLKVAENLLKLYGIEPDLASSGKEALKMIEEGDYQIVFLDHMMPEMDGIETLREIRSRGLGDKSMAVIAMTANAVVGAKEIYLESGFDGYISKPVDLELLGEILFKYLPTELVTFTREDSCEEDPVSEAEDTAENLDKKKESVVLEFAPKNRKVQGEEEPGSELKAALKKAGLDTEEGVKYSAGSEDLYLELLKDFVKDGEGRKKDLDRFFGAKDWTSYRVLVHAMKSGLRTLGAGELSKKAKELEDASGAGDEDYIDKEHGSFTDSYLKLVSDIGKAFDESEG